MTITVLSLFSLRTPLAWAQESTQGRHPGLPGTYGGHSRAQAESLLRSMFDTRMARQARGDGAAQLQAPLAHPKAPTSHSLHYPASGLASRQDQPFHPLKVTGASTFLSSHKGSAASVPTRQHGLAEALGSSSERGSTNKEEAASWRGGQTDFAESLRQRFREDNYQRFA